MTYTQQSHYRGGLRSSILIALLVVLLSLVASVEAISGRRLATSTLPKDVNTDGDAKDCQDNGKRRGKVLEERFDEHDLLQAYEEIKSEYHQKAFGGSASFEDGELSEEDTGAWKLLTTMNPNKRSDNQDEIIRISMMEHPSDPLCPYVKMETVMPVSLENCWNFLSLDKWDATMPKMDPFYEGLDIYGEYSVPAATNETSSEKDDKSELAVKMILARKRTKRILAFGKREFVFVSVEDTPLKDGTWVSGTVSVEVPEGDGKEEDRPRTADNDDSKKQSIPSLRRNKSYTRAFQDSIAFYKPIGENRTRLTIVCRIDLNDTHGSGGCIPMWLYVKTIGITGAKSVMSMRKCLLEGETNEK